MKGTSKQDAMFGRNGDDTMNGFAGNDLMRGNSDDDTMSGGSGHDEMIGEDGNDKINGDSGNDIIVGIEGTDSLFGSSENDKIYHFASESLPVIPTRPDGSKDDIHCGSGIDEAWINSSEDGDTADSDCETVHAG
jgi:Ca2+-binding RTX toxin-like protein